MEADNIKIRLAGIIEESVVDGKGFRFTIFVQGCPHNCLNCHNPQTHKLSGGEETALSELFAMIKANPLLDGVTYSGGEPFLYAEELSVVSDFVHGLSQNVWCYTGYTFEELKSMAAADLRVRTFFDKIDVLVDGRFIEEEKDLLLLFRGSKNQRIIDLKRMRECGSDKIIELPL